MKSIRYFLFLILICLSIFCLVFLFRIFIFGNRNARVEQHALEFTELARSWDEGIPLGNGMLGALIWQKGDHLRFSLDRADLWDLRPMENLSKPEFSFKWVQEQVKNKTYKNVQDLFDAPYNQLPAPSKIPGAAIEFDTRQLGRVTGVDLTLSDALCEVEWENGAEMESFVDASGQEGWFQFSGIPENFAPVIVPPVYRKDSTGKAENALTGQDLQRLGYDQGTVTPEPGKLVYRQKGWNGFEYEVAVAWKHSGKSLTGSWSITSSFSGEEGQKPASLIVSDQMTTSSFQKAFRSHEKWWNDFWSRSSVSIPDTVLEKQWYLEQYKFGSAARADAPPISLQAVWTADNGKLPPWKGDFHHDLNTQLSYWPSYSGNHLNLEEGFINWLWKYRDTFKKYTQTYFGNSGLNAPGVSTLTGEPMGGWIQYSFGPTVGCWLAQHFYLHWRYTMDEKFLSERAYPWISDVALYLSEISVRDEKGIRKLPISSSPEIHNNSINAWFPQTTNFDLAMIRWTFDKAAELALELGKKEESLKWKTILNEWPGFALDSLGGFAFAPGEPYAESHRHFSHLVAWHPLGLTDWSKGESNQKIIAETLKNLEKNGPDYWCGYSYSWLGNLYARAFLGNKADSVLRIFAENFCLPNSFHVNGEQHNKGYSKFKYRPFTLEGNFAFAAAIQEMLLQSHSGIVQIFPAIPDAWPDVSFNNLRSEGAFLISAVKSEGRTSRVVIFPEKGGTLRMLNPFKGAFIKKGSGANVKEDGGFLVINTVPRQKVVLEAE